MAEAKQVPFFHDNATHLQILNEVNESIIQLKEEIPEDKLKLDEIEFSFFMVLMQIWQTLAFINKRLLSNSKYTNSFISFLRYCRNLLMHTQQNQTALATQFGKNVTSDLLQDHVDEEVPWLKIHIQWIAKKFFSHLPLTQHFPEPCFRYDKNCLCKTLMDTFTCLRRPAD